MIHYSKSITRVEAIMMVVAVACLSGALGGYCGSLLTQKDRTKANRSITDAKENLKQVTAERDKLKLEYARLTAPRHNKPLATHQSRQQARERYYRDSKGIIISESQAEGQLQRIRDNIRSMPDNSERAYYEGMLQAVEQEWERTKRQGPISQ